LYLAHRWTNLQEENASNSRNLEPPSKSTNSEIPQLDFFDLVQNTISRQSADEFSAPYFKMVEVVSRVQDVMRDMNGDSQSQKLDFLRRRNDLYELRPLTRNRSKATIFKMKTELTSIIGYIQNQKPYTYSSFYFYSPDTPGDWIPTTLCTVSISPGCEEKCFNAVSLTFLFYHEAVTNSIDSLNTELFRPS
jgi:hypothetical protein